MNSFLFKNQQDWCCNLYSGVTISMSTISCRHWNKMQMWTDQRLTDRILRDAIISCMRNTLNYFDYLKSFIETKIKFCSIVFMQKLSSFQFSANMSFLLCPCLGGFKIFKVYPLFSCCWWNILHKHTIWTYFFSLVFSSHFLLHLFSVIMIRHSSMILSCNKYGVTVYLVILGWWGSGSKCWRIREADWKTDKGERSLLFFLLQMWSLGVMS